MKNILKIVLLLCFACGKSFGVTKTWDGGGANDNWTTPANWDADAAPTGGEDLVFAGSTRLTPNNDFAAATSFNTITFSDGSGNFVLGGNSVTITGGGFAVWAQNTSGTMSIGIALIFSTSAPTITTASGGTLNITSTIANGGLHLTCASVGTLDISGIVSGTGAMTCSGSGSVKLSAANTFSGGCNVSGGTLNISNADAMGSTSGTFTINNGVTINNTSGGILTTSNYPIQINGNFTFTGTNSLNLGTGAVTLGASPTITCSSSNLTFGGIISGAFNIIRVGTNGHLVLTNTASTYTGTTSSTTNTAGAIYFNSIQNVSGGASSLGAPTTAGNGTISLGSTTSPGKLIFQGSSSSTTDRVIDLASTTGNVDLIANGTGGATITYTSNLTVTGNGVKTLNLRGSSTGSNTISGVIPDGASATNVAKITEAGKWVLSGANTYTGSTTITLGTIETGAANVIPNASSIILNGGTFNTYYNETMSTLTMSSGGSKIYLGTGNHTVNFAASAGVAWAGNYLYIYDWLGGYDGTAAGGSDPKIFIGTGNNVAVDLTAAQLAKITFYRASNTQNYTATQLATGEVVPTGTLPVGIVSFTGEKVKDINRLSWVTASEINSDYFDVLRSCDGVSFEYIGRVEAAGNSHDFLFYSFDDLSPSNATNYYKFIEHDFDGAYQESEIIFINNEKDKKEQLLIYPNPSLNSASLNFNSLNAGVYDLKIYNAEGKEIYNALVAASSGENKFNVNTMDFASGIYYVELSGQKNAKLSTVLVKMD